MKDLEGLACCHVCTEPVLTAKGFGMKCEQPAYHRGPHSYLGSTWGETDGQYVYKVGPCPVAEKVAERVISRAEVGFKKYGVNLERPDLTRLEWLQHLQDELLDGANYVERLKADEVISKRTLKLATDEIERLRKVIDRREESK